METMNILVGGTAEFNDYTEFIRGMGVAMSDLGQRDLHIYTLGPVNINNFTAEFCNKVSHSMAQRGHKVKFSRIPAKQAQMNLTDYSWFGFFGEGRPSKTFYEADAEGVDCVQFRERYGKPNK